MFERLFEGVPFEIRKSLQAQMESAILEGVSRVREGKTDVLSCIARLSEIMILAGTLSHSTRKRGKSPKEDRADGAGSDG